jgi:hypothetical protein
MDPRYTTLASLGQRYQNYPAATFDQRFGPFNTGPRSDQDILRMFIEQEQMQRRDPNVIRPGTPSWPFGYTQT